MSKFNCMECWHVVNPYNHVDEVYDEVMLICCIVYNEFIEKFINFDIQSSDNIYNNSCKAV